MNFEWQLALRYFKGQRKGSRFLSFIKVMAITGVAIGSAGLLIALSIVHGFKSTINNKILEFAPHVTVGTFSGDELSRADTLLSHIERYPDVEAAQAVVTGETMIQSNDFVTGTLLKGVAAEGDITELRNYINRGNYDLTADSVGRPGIMLGAQLARTLQADIGSKITAYTVDGIPSPLNSPEIQQFRLTGVYQTGIDRFDEVFAIVDRQHAGRLFKMDETEASAIEVKAGNTTAIEELDSEISADMGYPIYSESIYERYGNIFAWVDLQEQTIPLVIGAMIIVAAFNLIGTVLMMVLERTRDIGILKTMGARSGKIRTVFMLEGFLVAAVGLLIGIALS
ncbi:MAG: ABC transporter permease, partial [Balneolaceae bacterium]